MGHERNIEAMRDARHGLPSGGGRRADRKRGRGRRPAGARRRRILALVILLVAVAAVVALVVHFTAGSGAGGGFAGTWRKSTPGTQLVIKEAGDGQYTIAVALKPSPGGSGGTSAAKDTRDPRVSKATLDNGVLTATDMLGVQGLTVTFTLEDDGAILVESFPSGPPDRLERVD
jgi:hypothetical protein